MIIIIVIIIIIIIVIIIIIIIIIIIVIIIVFVIIPIKHSRFRLYCHQANGSQPQYDLTVHGAIESEHFGPGLQ